MVEAQSVGEGLNMRKLRLIALAACGFVAAEAGICFASGNLEVTETNTPSVVKSQTFSETDEIKLPENAKIMVLDSATNATATCAGPYSGPIGKCPGEQKCGLIWRLLGRCGETVNHTSGGTRSVRP
jgi:hypothetical protein